MHVPENYLSPETCAVMTAAMLPVWTHSVRKVKAELPKEKIAMIGVGAAFSFLGMMFNVPLVGGTTGHAVGGTLIALLFGPEAACLAVSIALLLQAVIFGDGGILSFGANCFNMAFVLPFVGYGIYRLIAGRNGETNRPGRYCEETAPGRNIEETAPRRYCEDTVPGRSYAGAAAGSYIGICLAALFCAVEFGIQPMIAHDAMGNALYCPYDLSVSIPAMMIPHMAVAGIVEAVFTVAVYAFIRRTAPDLTYDHILLEKNAEIDKNIGMNCPENVFGNIAVGASVNTAADIVSNFSGDRAGEDSLQTASDIASSTAVDVTKDATANIKGDFSKNRQKRYVPVFALIAVLIAAVPLGLLATGTAWGEWGADEIADIVTEGQALGYTPSGMEGGFSLDAIMPDYTLGETNEVIAYILSAIIGTALLIIVFKLLSLALKGKRNRYAS